MHRSVGIVCAVPAAPLEAPIVAIICSVQLGGTLLDKYPHHDGRLRAIDGNAKLHCQAGNAFL